MTVTYRDSSGRTVTAPNARNMPIGGTVISDTSGNLASRPPLTSTITTPTSALAPTTPSGGGSSGGGSSNSSNSNPYNLTQQQLQAQINAGYAPMGQINTPTPAPTTTPTVTPPPPTATPEVNAMTNEQRAAIPGGNYSTIPGGFNTATGQPNTPETPTTPVIPPVTSSDLAGQYSALLGKSPEELALESQGVGLDSTLKNFNQSADQMGLNVDAQPIAQGFLTGQNAALQKQNAITREGITNDQQTLQQKLALAQERRMASIDQIKFQLLREDTAKETQTKQSENAMDEIFRQSQLAEQIRSNKASESISSQKASSIDSYKPPTSYQEWQLAGSPGTYADYLKDSNVKAPTGAQQTVATYAARIEQSNPIISSLTDSISKMNLVSFETQKKLPSAFQSSTFQQYDQASRNYINAVLRRESGAVISPSEFDNAYKQYLPKPGDSTITLKQKKDNRDVVYASLKNAAGNAYQSVNDLLGTSNDPMGIR